MAHACTLQPPLLPSLKQFEPERLEPEFVYKLRTPRVVFADHDLLQQDFAFLREGSVEQWLLNHAAFVSEAQLKQTIVNTSIETNGEKVTAFRPPNYGRALIFQTEQGLLDVKGVGVAPGVRPKHAPHSNGLIMLGEAIREAIIEKILNRIFEHSASCVRAVPCYGVIDTGFDLTYGDGLQVPAGLLVRRAHVRPIHPLGVKESSSPLVDLELAVELLLRKYGVTSIGTATIIEVAECGAETTIKYGSTALRYKEDQVKQIKELAKFEGGRKILEGVVVQFTRDAETDPRRAEVIDFGGFYVKARFENPIVSLVADRLLRLGEIISPSDERFVQPDEKIRLPYELWGRTGRIWGYEASESELVACAFRVDNPLILGFNLAREFRENKISSEDVRKKIEEYLNASTAHWDQRTR